MTEAAQKRVPPRPPPVDVKPIIGGRLWIPIVMLSLIGAMANPKFNGWISQRFAPKEPRTNLANWKVGKEAKLRVTLVTADAERLSCAHDAELDGAHCAYKADKSPWEGTKDGLANDNRPDVIQPFRTSPENHLILIAGLWADPAVAMRLHQEPPDGLAVKRLNRFEAACTVEFIGEMKGLELRWADSGPWGKEPRALVARPKSCEIVR